MTLPFRRRHHDDDTPHDRARSLLSAGLLEPLEGDDASWLENHLRICPDCRAEGDAYASDRALLRSLRDRPIEPPHDLWVHTRAAIEGEARARRRARAPQGLARRLSGGGGTSRAGQRQIILPLGLVAGAMVALIVVATAVVPSPTPGTALLPTQRATSNVALGTPLPTNFLIAANPVGWAQANADGTYSLHFAKISEVCPDARPDCPELGDADSSPVRLPSRPQSLVQSPNEQQLAIVSSATGSDGTIVILPISPGSSPSPTATTTATATATVTPTSTTATSTPSAPGASATPARPSGSPIATVEPSPDGSRTIVRGVRVVGQPGYSRDGAWFAFSARPLGGETGPDLYVWHMGDAEATKLTSDGATFFSGWVGQRILASRVETAGPSALPSAGSSAAPSPAPSRSNAASRPSASPRPTAAQSPAASEAPVDAHPVSFLIDPATSALDELPIADIWMPSVDPTGTFVTYWSGTVRATQNGTWGPATGRLVLDAWTAPVAVPSPDSSGASSTAPTSAPTSAATPPASSSSGTAGVPFELATGPLADFETRFDLNGSHLAVWTLDAAGANVGQLRLLVLDPSARSVAQADPLAKEPALRGFSLEPGRLGWVQPEGQNGEQSTVKVLAWTGRTFGKVQAAPGGPLVIIR